MSSDMRGEAPAVTEDSDLVAIIRELYKGRVGRNQKTSDFCVGGALCHYFLRYDNEWSRMQKPPFPFPDQMVHDLEWIVRDFGSDRIQEYYFNDDGDDEGEEEFTETLDYYADAITDANDLGEYDDAWIHVDMFLKEFEID